MLLSLHFFVSLYVILMPMWETSSKSMELSSPIHDGDNEKGFKKLNFKIYTDVPTDSGDACGYQNDYGKRYYDVEKTSYNNTSPNLEYFKYLTLKKWSIQWLNIKIRYCIHNYFKKKYLVLSLLIFILYKFLTKNIYFNSTTRLHYIETQPFDFVMDNEVIEYVHNFNANQELIRQFAENDVRQTPAQYLAKVANRMENGLPIQPVSFSWSDWIDFDLRLLPGLEYLTNNNGNNLRSCEEFAEKIGFPGNNILRKDYIKNCVEIPSDKSTNYPSFKITGHLDDYKLSPEARILYGSSYIYHSMEIPKRLIFTEGLNNANLILPISNEISYSKSYEQSKMDVPLTDLTWKVFNNLLASEKSDLEPVFDVPRFEQNDGYSDQMELTYADFQNYDGIKSIKAKLSNQDVKDSLDFKLYKNILQTIEEYPTGDYPKYFHESAVNSKNIEGSHYDWRFFNIKEANNEYKRISILNRLIKAWLRFSQIANLQTWISHGTMLGYSYNEKMLPWDFDHDVQISSKSMWELARNFNQSIIVDVTLDDDEYSTGFGQYYLDVSNNFFNREPANGNNAIDARFIDIHTGMYIDITQIAQVKNINKMVRKRISKVDWMQKNEFFKLLEKNNLKYNSLSDDDQLLGCRNFHFYTFNELSILEKSKFQNNNCYIPKSFDEILEREFPLRKVEWSMEGFTWRTKLGEWINDKRCSEGKKDRLGISCSGELIDLLFTSSSIIDWDAVVAVESAVGHRNNY